MNKSKKILLSVLIGTALTLISFYIWLPALNPRDPGFWTYLAFVIAFYALPFLFLKSEGKKNPAKPIDFKLAKGPLIAILVPVAIMIVGNVASSEIFNATKYADVADIEEAVFEEDMPETDEVTNIALMDGYSAQILGNRTLGALSDVVSQYELGYTYTQINYNQTPQKVENLEYVDFFKWLNNRSVGIPGYVMVDPVNHTAEYMELEKPMKYVESAYFHEDLMRKLRFSYPTKIMDFVTYEIDDDGNPYFVVSCLEPQVGLFGAMDVTEVIIFDPVTGDSDIYAVADVPEWVDTVFSGDLAVQKYNWHGILAGGFINSIIGNKGCTQTTADYGYIVLDDDVWYFTGVTSVTSDQSNVGFIISNARTGEYKYYEVAGAEEYSAMAAAQGEVQEMGYTASFPSLINVSGEATYIMVLKDNAGLVKLYALVNVENYGIVATGSTQKEAMQLYKELLEERGVVDKEPEPEVDILEATFTVVDVKTVVLDGSTVLYFEDEDGTVYKAMLSENEAFILVDVGSEISVEFADTDIDGIKLITKLK